MQTPTDRSHSGHSGRDSSFVAFDTERATASGAPHLLEIGAVRVADGEVQEHFQRLVCPPVPIDDECTRVHGITDDDVRAAETADAVVAAFFAWIGSERLIAHNARADAHVIGFECARHGLTPPPNRIIDTLALARKALPDAPDHQLATLVEHLGLETDDAHRALPDAVLCWQVFEACVERLGGPGSLTEARLFDLAGIPITLATSLPARPNRRPAHLRALEAARSSERSVVLTYGKKTEPPARLEVLPRLLFRQKDKSYLEGECARSGLLKTYRLDRIHRIESTP